MLLFFKDETANMSYAAGIHVGTRVIYDYMEDKSLLWNTIFPHFWRFDSVFCEIYTVAGFNKNHTHKELNYIVNLWILISVVLTLKVFYKFK